MVTTNKVAGRLYELGAFKDYTHETALQRENGERGFKLKLHEKNPEAVLSPFYLNLRTPNNPKPGPLTPDILADIAWLMTGLAEKGEYDETITYDYICGLPRAGDPLAQYVMAYSRIGHGSPQLLHLQKEESDGTRRIIGPPIGASFEPGQTVLLVDDLITKADSKLEAIRVIEEAGLVVGGVIVLIDREQGGMQDLIQNGYRAASVLTLTQLLDHLVKDHISSELRSTLLEYIRSE